MSPGDNLASCFAPGFDYGRRNHEPRNAENAALEVAKDKETSSYPSGIPEGAWLCSLTPSIQLSETDVGLLTSMTVREVCVKPPSLWSCVRTS